MLEAKGIRRELTYADFLKLDDHSFLTAVRELEGDRRLGVISEYGQKARKVMLRAVSDYVCRVLEKPPDGAVVPPITSAPPLTIPPDVFVDLQSDHDREHRLYAPESVRVKQSLTEKMPSAPVPLEKCSGALASVFGADSSVSLVKRSFYIFLPETTRRGNPGDYQPIEEAMTANLVQLHDTVDREDIMRDLQVPDDTWASAASGRKKIAISCSFKDRAHVIRVIQSLHEQKEPYRVLLDSLLWLGGTAPDNSRKLIQEADAVLVLLSAAYIESWKDPIGNIATEASEIYGKPTNRKAIIPLLPYADLNAKMASAASAGLAWKKLDSNWNSAPIIAAPVARITPNALKVFVKAACNSVNQP